MTRFATTRQLQWNGCHGPFSVHFVAAHFLMAAVSMMRMQNSAAFDVLSVSQLRVLAGMHTVNGNRHVRLGSSNLCSSLDDENNGLNSFPWQDDNDDDNTSKETKHGSDHSNSKNKSNRKNASTDRSGGKPEYENDDVIAQLETARQDFERQFQRHLFPDTDDYFGRHFEVEGSDRAPPSEIVTQSKLRLMELELQLLESLYDSDDAVDSLMDLWVQETRNTDAIETLNAMEIWCSPTLEKEATMLLGMIDEQPGWMEPCSRLALVRYYQDDVTASLTLCRHVLQYKPWQFEAAQTLIWSALRVGDWMLALSTARNDMLPGLRQAKRRKRWVDRNVVAARTRLAEARSLHGMQHSNFAEVDADCSSVRHFSLATEETSTALEGAVISGNSTTWQ
eukprot:CAMPEP_0119547102 /NCGR_PEP_ID=MMETSP1352-20130426/1318_1 /TAXON_ID=265584 /ORGANISM="Stauroneis constricta, Strain CCMP1120" /LENGTH=393 /DNA_ID=CAMNT_0007591947 /DNA_START=80 /DNA_END=1261 /DNA_ORIENTATION=-